MNNGGEAERVGMESVAENEEQALIVMLRLPESQFGVLEEHESIGVLIEQFFEVIPGVGEYDGDSFGEGFCTFYFYGPSADRLFQAVFPVINTYPTRSGSHIVCRYGGVGSPEKIIDLHCTNVEQ